MSALPPRIERRIDTESEFAAVRIAVVESLREADRPFLSTRQLRTQYVPDIEEEILLDQLEALRASDVVATASYAEPTTLHYVRDPDSERPPDRTAVENPLDRLSLRRFLTLRDTAGVRTLVLAGFQLSLLLVALGTLLTVFGVDAGTESDIVLWDTAFDLFGVCLLLLVAERISNRVRSDATD